ncbi:MAG: hypothetical protein V1732_00600 [Patescibacteria group bacterium]|nr:hypothetical protein [Patescibacteria group bacterium]
MYRVEIPKILFLALDIASFYRNSFFNTNDLAELSNRYKSDLVRQRIDKKDYKYLEDTRFGGLRGNFSTLLTWRGLVKRGSAIINSYSLGKDNRLVNAICNGKIILNREDLSACTNDGALKNLLETEAWLLTIRETQAHVKTMLKRNPDMPLKRDNVNFPKEAVFKSNKNQYFIRALLNNFVDSKNTILQFNIINLWEGKKFNKYNLHPVLVIPTKDNPWNEIYAIKNEDLYQHKPILLNVDIISKKCTDKNSNIYTSYPFSQALIEFSGENENIKNRLDYKWEDLRNRYCEKEIDYEVRKEDEFSNFLRLFLDWNRHFFIDKKEVVDVRTISSGGPDVELIFSGGTLQKVELEHNWNNYLDHKHQNNNAFKNVWIFAEEKFDLAKILKLYEQPKKDHNDRIPDIFLCIGEDNQRHAYKINWKEKKAEEMNLKFE